MRDTEFWDKHYLRIAKEISNLSYAIRRKVGCVIVKDRQMISDGYNGTPQYFDNICEDIECTLESTYCCPVTEKSIEISKNIEICKECKYCNLVTKPYVLHAEANAITKLSKSTMSADGATLYVTDEPCFECSKLIIQSNIKRVVYWREYRKHDGIELLKQANIEIIKYDEID